MAAASLDVNFKEELSAIEQCPSTSFTFSTLNDFTNRLSHTGFKVLSEAERTAALYSLLQHSTQVQIRFFITVLQQMARSDPMTALLSPAVGGSMQAQMEAKLASIGALKSPGLKSNMPSSPSARNFPTGPPPPSAGGRQSLAFDNSSSFLSPDSAALAGGAGGADAAATLAQQRAKLNANHAARRISAPALASGDGRGAVWGNGSTLAQVSERSGSPSQELTIPSEGAPARSRPQSTDFTGLAAGAALRSPRPDVEAFSPMAGDSWASMVNTPLIPMFNNKNSSQALDAAAQKLNDWSGASRGGVPLMDDAKKYRRASKTNTQGGDNNNNGSNQNGAVYDDAGNLISQGGGAGSQGGQGQQQGQQQQGQRRNVSGGNLGPGGWNNNNNNPRSPALSTHSSGRFGGSDTDPMGGMAGGLPPGFGAMAGLASPALAGMNGMNPNQLLAAAGMFGMNGLNGMNMNMLNMANLSAMGISPEAQILAAQMAAASGGGLGMNGFGGMGQPGLGAFVGMGQAGMGGGMRGMGGGSGRNGGGRSPGLKSNTGGSNSGKKGDEEDVDPQLLNDIPAWLRSLRLHKYTPNFEGMHWREMVVMDEGALEAKGVAALGARRKMLKTFEVVRKKMGVEVPGEGASS